MNGMSGMTNLGRPACIAAANPAYCLHPHPNPFHRP